MWARTRQLCWFSKDKNRGFENHTFNMISHSIIILKGFFTSADLNQHLFFIKLAAIHRWSTARCACNPHLQIPRVNSDMGFFSWSVKFASTVFYLEAMAVFFFRGVQHFSYTTFISYRCCKWCKRRILLLHSTQFTTWRGYLVFKLALKRLDAFFNCNTTLFYSTDCLET